MANNHVQLIERTRSEVTPQIGDRLVYVTADPVPKNGRIDVRFKDSAAARVVSSVCVWMKSPLERTDHDKIHTAPRKVTLCGVLFIFNDKQIKPCMPSSPNRSRKVCVPRSTKDTFRHRLRQGPHSGGEHLQLLHRHRRTAQPQAVRFCQLPRVRRSEEGIRDGTVLHPHEVCRDMADMLSPTSSEMILDMCCGMGNFFNHLPNLHNAYGFDIDGKAVSVARYLYPDAHIEKCDLRQYYPEQRFDIVIGNPPFQPEVRLQTVAGILYGQGL